MRSRTPVLRYCKMNTKIEMIEDFKDSVCSPTLDMMLTIMSLIAKLMIEMMTVQMFVSNIPKFLSFRKMSQIGSEITFPS